jgi:very-short-patch-repair endonuclease
MVRGKRSWRIIMKRRNIERSRQLRKNQTDAERKMWSILRNRQLNGVKFRRQFSIGRFIVDFYSPEFKLGIEADGGGHYKDEERVQDERRTSELSELGVEILRFSDLDILKNIEGVYQVILKTIENKKTPHPNPLPSGEREKNKRRKVKTFHLHPIKKKVKN